MENILVNTLHCRSDYAYEGNAAILTGNGSTFDHAFDTGLAISKGANVVAVASYERDKDGVLQIMLDGCGGVLARVAWMKDDALEYKRGVEYSFACDVSTLQ